MPGRLIGGQVRVLLHANDLVIFDGRQQVARRDRLTGRLEAHLELDHYLEALIRRPGALPGATALEQARPAAGTRVNNVRREHSWSTCVRPVPCSQGGQLWRWAGRRS